MKKFLAMILGAMLVFGFAASAFAIHAEIPSETQAVVAKGSTQITLGGELRFRGEIQNNVDLDSKDEVSDTKAYYDGRVRLRLQADVSKNTTGVVHLESNTGTSADNDTYTWGTAPIGDEGKGVYPVGNSKRGNLAILEAWIQHKGSGLLGIPAGIKVGHMPLALGNKLFFDHSKFGDDAIVFFMDPTKELHIGLLTIKLKEGTDTAADDADAYVALMNYKSGKTSLGFDVTYVDDKRNWIDGKGAANPSTLADSRGTHLYNIGLRGETEISGFGIKADIEMQTGKSKSETADMASGIAGTQNSIKHKGYAYLVGLSYKLDPVKLSLDYAYGSGDDATADDKNKTFITALSGTQKFTYVYDYRVTAATGSLNTGIANTQYWKLGGNADITKDLNADVNLYVLRASKKRAITISGGNTTAGDSKNIGTELDAKITYKIDRNLVYFVEGGYLWVGNFYNPSTTTAKKDDAYAVRHGITLSF